MHRTRALPTVCVIGAGASGIAASRALSRRGIPFDWFEKGDRVGGIWAFENASGLSPAYRELHINVSRERCEFSDWPMPKSYPLFPHHSQITRYYEDYVEHFGLHRQLRLAVGVERAEPRRDGGWDVRLQTGDRRRYDALVVANGHHAKPHWPNPAPSGEFAGLQIHSHAYRDRESLRGRDVVVVGFGNSACDIAVEASYVARSTALATRRASHVVPFMQFGRPHDQVPGMNYLLGKAIGLGRLSFRLPWLPRQLALTGAHRAANPMPLYGLENPRHLFGAVHPTQGSHLLERLLHGTIDVRPPIHHLEGENVVFSDRTRGRADTIVWCTGYEIDFPFLPRGLVPVEENRVDLYRHVFRPGVPSLAFVGLGQPSAGSLMQIAEIQARWVAAYLAGDCALPSEDRMRREIARRRRRVLRRQVRSPRHTMEIEQFDYAGQVDRELRRGTRRARRGGQPAVVAHHR
jgi:dimethylaniline monooxygenase (N-oxide forming)